ncbi:MAG: hydroxymethylglutaryl-CoA lyase [Fimbriimonadaceae bacterium]
MSDLLRVIEVSPRDGLQNEKIPVSTEVKAQFVCDLVKAGLKEIEVTSFVHPKWVPQLADAGELLGLLGEIKGVRLSTLVPNERGLDRAIEMNVPAIAVFTAASEAFVQKNINMSIDESLEVFDRVIKRYRECIPSGFVRGYLSTIVECPFAGKIDSIKVARLTAKLFELGCDEVSLGETIGGAVPKEIDSVAQAIKNETDQSKIIWHFHDTRGTAIANVASMLDRGYRAFDSSAGGLGGCPYAPGAGGNLATEDLVYFAERNGIATGLDLLSIAEASLPVLAALDRSPVAKSQLAVLAACKSP